MSSLQLAANVRKHLCVHASQNQGLCCGTYLAMRCEQRATANSNLAFDDTSKQAFDLNALEILDTKSLSGTIAQPCRAIAAAVNFAVQRRWRQLLLRPAVVVALHSGQPETINKAGQWGIQMRIQLAAIREALSKRLAHVKERTVSPEIERNFKSLTNLVTFTVKRSLIALFVVVTCTRLASAATVTLSPGDNIQNAVNNHPGGTTFILQPGIYRGNSVTSLKDGDRFIGRAGADMNGAKLLRNWTTVSIGGVQYWTRAGGAPLDTPPCPSLSGVCCQPNNPGCLYVQDLYVDNVDYRHVTSLTKVVSGSWYYAFTSRGGAVRNNIYMFRGDHPNSHTVELGTSNYAFKDTASNITIKNLTIEKYAAPLESGAVVPAGSSWLIQNNEFRLNHGWGVKVMETGNNVQVLGNNLHDNGEGGMGAGGITGGRFDSNSVVHNNIDSVLTWNGGRRGQIFRQEHHDQQQYSPR